MAFKIAGQNPAGSPPASTSAPAARPPVPQRPGFTPRPQVSASRPPAPSAPRPACVKPAASKSSAAVRHGWSSAPPVRGSSYTELLEWANDQHLFYKDAESLALDIMTGVIEVDEEPSAPGMR